MSTSDDVSVVTADLPDAVLAVWSPRHNTLVVSPSATAEDLAAYYPEIGLKLTST